MIKTKYNPSNFKRESGLSLIEVIVSITLLSYIMVEVLRSTDQATAIKDKIIVGDNEIIQTEMAMERLNLDLTQIYSPLYFSGPKKPQRRQNRYSYQDNDPQTRIFPYRPTKMFPRESSDGLPIPLIDDDKGFAFLTSSNKRKFENVKQSQYAWVRYSLRNITLKSDDEDIEALKGVAPYELIRTYIPDDIYREDIDWSKIKPQILLRFVKSLKFEFWDSKREKYVENLRDLNDPKATNLRSIKVTVKWFNKRNQEKIATRVTRPLWPIFDTKKDDSKN
ncbi:MAG: hypothetical protein VYD54_00180 [Bdellovibrionota bacterium]|nr:hypothetical protein [Bdellovibrionota bacterium]